MRYKKAIFFSIDALIALSIILLVILIAFPIVKQTKQTPTLQFDILNTLSNLKMGEAVGIPSYLITDPYKSALEQIGEFYISNISAAKELANLTLFEINTNENVGLWFESTLIWSSNSTDYNAQDTNYIDAARQVISGIQNGTNITGFAARAFLTSNLKNKYFYFGGYVGDGNISIPLNYTGTIRSAKMELVISKNFTLFINGDSVGEYNKSTDEKTPIEYDLSPGALLSFNSDIGNLIEFKGDSLHIAGGFFKIVYETEEPFSTDSRYQFPSVDGLINIYDGFYIPTTLTSMNITLHMNSSVFDTFLTIGNETVYEGKTTNDDIIILDDAFLDSILEYDKLSGKTIPLRIGLRNITNVTPQIDVISVNDLSNSMFISYGPNQPAPIIESKAATKEFISFMLNESVQHNNRVGLVGYGTTAPANAFHELSQDNTSLIDKVTSWTDLSSTCICCGINRAITELDTSSRDFKSMIVMSDGIATETCLEQGEASPKEDAIQAACDAHVDHGIIVHAIAFGSFADTETLESISQCGEGSFYSGGVGELSQFYNEIAQTLIAQFNEQTISVTENISTKLYTDSFIDFGYSIPQNPSGLIITAEKKFTDASHGKFNVSSDATMLETIVTSYSGPKWTNNLDINSNPVFALSNYGNDFQKLGDPYNLNIPISLINPIVDNIVEITTGNTPLENAEGSASNKMIYTIVKNVSSFSQILSYASGCNWNIQFEDDSNVTGLPIPTDYTGSDSCYYSVDGYFANPSCGVTPCISNQNDAFQEAVLNLLVELDLNFNNKIDVPFAQQDLEITLTEIVGIPFAWETEVEVRVWS